MNTYCYSSNLLASSLPQSSFVSSGRKCGITGGIGRDGVGTLYINFLDFSLTCSSSVSLSSPMKNDCVNWCSELQWHLSTTVHFVAENYLLQIATVICHCQKQFNYHIHFPSEYRVHFLEIFTFEVSSAFLAHFAALAYVSNKQQLNKIRIVLFRKQQHSTLHRPLLTDTHTVPAYLNILTSYLLQSSLSGLSNFLTLAAVFLLACNRTISGQKKNKKCNHTIKSK